MVRNLTDKLVATIEGRYRRPVTLISEQRGLARGTPISSKAVRCFAAAIVALLAALSLARAQDVSRDPNPRERAGQRLVLELEGCPDLPACLAILDAFLPSLQRGQSSGVGTSIASSLRRFGEPAKQELLRRAAGALAGWRNLAGDILAYWGGWLPSDVPAIRASLQLDHGGWMARPLAEIATPEAIEALIEDLAALRDAQNQTGWALAKIGPVALPYLLPVLADEEQAFKARGVIHGMKKQAWLVAPEWASLAAGMGNPKNMRLAALRGLAAMGEGAREHGKVLRALLASPDSDIRTQVFKTLVAMRDPSVATTVAENCHPMATAFYERSLEARYCLWEVAAFGEHARSAGPHLMKFLASPSGEELVAAVTALGSIGYDAAIPRIEQLLRSPDWRVVYAAARSLGWLGATGSVPELERVVSGHWLPEVRDHAVTVADALKGSERRMARPEGAGILDVGGGFFGGGILRSVPSCGSRRWEWQGVRFSPPSSSTRTPRLSLDAGALIGTNKGEFGGELTWQPIDGQAQLLLKDNVVAIEPADGGAIVLFGLAHMGLVRGYAVRVSQRGDGGWSLAEVARLPSTADALATIGPNLFAAWSENRVVVLSDKEILGLARCIEQ